MKRMIFIFSVAMVAVLMIFFAYQNHTISIHTGYRGTGQFILYQPSNLPASIELNSIPEADPIDEPDPTLPTVRQKYKNVQVLDDLSLLEFSRLMGALATWVAPEVGCEYCHNPKNLASDEKYTKRVARVMLKMTRKINNEWKAHVGGVGVTCWTCHRGKSVPTGDWYTTANLEGLPPGLGNKENQSTPGIANIANTALPYDPLSKYLVEDNEIRVQGTVPLAGSNQIPQNGVRKAEVTYALMIYISKALGVNCNYCHNTRAFGSWPDSKPERVTAWYGIRMVRDLNNNFLLSSVASELPSYRLGEFGDGPKVACATCHKGTFKPLFGKSMKDDYPELWRTGGPQIDTGYVSPPHVEVNNPIVPRESLVSGHY
jgi:photosynthetic reaction center cytochrome c subunit